MRPAYAVRYRLPKATASGHVGGARGPRWRDHGLLKTARHLLAFAMGVSREEPGRSPRGAERRCIGIPSVLQDASSLARPAEFWQATRCQELNEVWRIRHCCEKPHPSQTSLTQSCCCDGITRRRRSVRAPRNRRRLGGQHQWLERGGVKRIKPKAFKRRLESRWGFDQRACWCARRAASTRWRRSSTSGCAGGP